MYYYFCEFTASWAGASGGFGILMRVMARARAFAAYLLMAVDIDSYR
jgi:hypothetical protein